LRTTASSTDLRLRISLTRTSVVVLSLGLWFGPSAALAQTPVTRTWPVSGIVVDSSGRAIQMARVQLLGLGRGVSTGPDGRFRFDSVSTGPQRLLVRAISFAVQTPMIEVKVGDGWVGTIVLARLAQTLPDIEVEAEVKVPFRLEGFERRRKHGLGVYLTEEQIKRRFERDALGLLRGIAGIKLSFRLGGTAVEFARCRERVAYWVDGVRYRDGIPGYVSPATIVGMEVYRGVAELPAEFLDDACAAVVIWTR